MVLDIKKRLQDEIQVLETELKIHLPKEIQRAREHAPRSFIAVWLPSTW
jgi:hypothetical protein